MVPIGWGQCDLDVVKTIGATKQGQRIPTLPSLQIHRWAAHSDTRGTVSQLLSDVTNVPT